MKTENIALNFCKESKQMQDLRLESINAQLEYEKAENNNDPNIKMYEKKLKDAEKREDSFSEIYAKTVFDYFKDKSPVLIRRRTNQEVLWSEAFGSDYLKLSKELKGSLIALIEKDGGQYRLA